jgi:hypothetical protein
MKRAWATIPASCGSIAWAQSPAPAAPPPYSLPWLLRPATPATVVRLDETLAFYEDPASATPAHGPEQRWGRALTPRASAVGG